MEKTRKERTSLPSRTEPSHFSIEIRIEIGLPSTRLVETIYNSLLPETRQPPGFRSRTLVRRRGRVLVLNIKADDLVALRAATNTFLRFVSVALKTLNVFSHFYRPASRD